MWKGRAIGFVEALMKVLVAMRDAGHILLDANVIRNYFVTIMRLHFKLHNFSHNLILRLEFQKIVMNGIFDENVLFV